MVYLLFFSYENVYYPETTLKNNGPGMQAIQSPVAVLHAIYEEFIHLNKKVRIIQEYGPSTGRAEHVSRLHMLQNDLVHFETQVANNPTYGVDLSRLYQLRSSIDALLIIVNHFVVGSNVPFTRKYFLEEPAKRRSRPTEKHTIVRFADKLYQVRTSKHGIEVTYIVAPVSVINFWAKADIDLDAIY